jgi:hypothetical protein
MVALGVRVNGPRSSQFPALAIHGAALHAMAEGNAEEAAQLSAMLAQVLRERRRLTTRMLQALAAYLLHCDGLPIGRNPRGRYDMEDWWGRFERYRGELEAMARS